MSKPLAQIHVIFLTRECWLLALHEGPKFIRHIELVVLIAIDLKLAANSLGRHGLQIEGEKKDIHMRYIERNAKSAGTLH